MGWPKGFPSDIIDKVIWEGDKEVWAWEITRESVDLHKDALTQDPWFLSAGMFS